MEYKNDKSKSENGGKYDCSLISEFSPKLNNVLNKIIVKEGYYKYNINKRAILTNGGSYFGDLYEIDIEGETGNGRKETNIFIKHIPCVDNMKTVSIPRMYENELFTYNELSRLFTEIQKEAGISINEQFKMVKTYGECIIEAIILENVSRNGYKTPQRLEVVSLEFAEQAIKTLAKFHCLSYAIREKRPVYYSGIIKNIKTPQIFEDDWQDLLKTTCNLATKCFNEDSKEKLEKIIINLLDKYPLYMQETSKVSCLCHGDYRPNNIMMKEINGHVTDLIPIDYQLLHYGNPVFDFFYFIFLSTDRKFRRLHMNNLKNLYYEAMSEFLNNFDINVEEAFPRMEFEKVYKEKLDLGLMILIIFGPFIFADGDDTLHICKNSLSEITLNASEKYKDMLLETVEDFKEWGYLMI